MQNNPFLVVLLGDFNAKSSNWCKNGRTTNEGKILENTSSQFALHQVINEPTHILKTCSSCVDLIFTSQSNLITEPGVHPYPSSNSHYLCEVWHHQDANTDFIRRAIDMFDFDRAFVNTNANEKLFILNKTILNILSNFFPHET